MTTAFFSTDKDINKLCSFVVRSGSVKLVNGAKHKAFVRSDGHKLPIPGTPSGGRSFNNFEKQLKTFVPEAFSPKFKEQSTPVAEAIAEVAAPVEEAFVNPIEAVVNTQISIVDISLEELRNLVAQKEREEREKLAREKEGEMKELERLTVDIVELKKMLDESSAKKLWLEQKYQLGAPKIVIPVSGLARAVERALADPVCFSNGNINSKATADKHGLPVKKVREAVLARGLSSTN